MKDIKKDSLDELIDSLRITWGLLCKKEPIKKESKSILSPEVASKSFFNGFIAAGEFKNED